MEPEKRTERRDDGEMGRKRVREDGVAEEEERKAVTTEEEVEEFFAILKRIHVAVKYFEKRRSPSFRIEDFNGDAELDGENEADGFVGKNSGFEFDLNADPSS